MKTFFQTIALLLLSILPGLLQAQLFETTLGDAAGIEDTWDGRPLATGDYVMLANTLSFSATSQILVTTLDPTGAPILVFSLRDNDAVNDIYVGKAFEVDIDAGGNPIGLFITGYVQTANSQYLIVIKTDLAGGIIWAKRMDNVYQNTVYKESGVSIERQSDGSVVVVGVANQAANADRVVAARLNGATGASIWTRRYTPAAGESYLPAESCNGTVNGAAVVGITGKYTSGNTVNTFGMSIQVSNGAEVWRRTYQTGQTANQGHDIVQNPANARFLIVGQAADAGGNQDFWVLNVNGNNGAIPAGGNAATYNLGVNYSKFIGRDVCLNTTANGGAIAGLVESVPVAGGVATRRVFFTDLTFAFPANLPGTLVYTDSDPNVNGSESIEPTPGANLGYFICSDAYLTAAASFDMHAIRTDAAGAHPLADCPQTPLNPARILQGASVNKARANTVETWVNFDPENNARDLVDEPCDGVPFGGGEIEERDNGNDSETLEIGGNSLTTKLFPNPASGNATLRLEIDEEQPVQIAVLDLGGRLIFSQNQTLPEGGNDLVLPAADWQPGAYFVRIVTAQVSQTMKFSVQR